MLVMVAFGLGEIMAYCNMKIIIAFYFVIFLWCILNFLTDKNFISAQRIILAALCILPGYILMGNACREYGRIEDIFLSGINNITGMVTDIESTSKGYVLTAESEDYGNVLIYANDADNIHIGNNIKAEVSYIEFEGARNEGCFDDRQYYHSVGISGRFFSDKVHITDRSVLVLKQKMYELKVMVRGILQNTYNEEKSSVYSAMLLGDKSSMADGIKELYKDAGIFHLYCISGTHMAILGMGIYGLFRRRFKFILSGTGAVCVIILYGAFTGMGISVMRAVIMISIRIAADMFGRTYDMISSLSLAAVMIMLFNPCAILNSGFAMSFAAVASICTIIPAVEKIYTVKDRFIKSILYSAGISIGMLPVMAYYYSEISVYGVFVNLIVIPFVGYILFSGVASIVFSFINISAGMFFAGLGNYLLDFYNYLCNVIMGLPMAVYVTGKPDVWRIAIFYSVLMAVLFLALKYLDFEREFWEQNWYIRYGKTASGIFVIVTIILILIYKPCKGICVKYIDVGQGDSTFIQTDKNVEYLIDAGSSDVSDAGKYRILPVLKASGVNSLDYLIVTHTDNDHINGIETLINEKSGSKSFAKTLVLPDINDRDNDYIKLERTARNNNVSVEYISAGKGWRGKNYEFTCLYPYKDSTAPDKNELSVVMKLKIKNTSFMFMGDLGKEGEKELIRKGGLVRCNVLKAGHHGSKNSGSEEFLHIVKPALSIISCGADNSYGHPHIQAVNGLKSIGSRIYRTDYNGEITVYTDKNSVKVESYIK